MSQSSTLATTSRRILLNDIWIHKQIACKMNTSCLNENCNSTHRFHFWCCYPLEQSHYISTCLNGIVWRISVIGRLYLANTSYEHSKSRRLVPTAAPNSFLIDVMYKFCSRLLNIVNIAKKRVTWNLFFLLYIKWTSWRTNLIDLLDIRRKKIIGYQTKWIYWT